MKKSGKSIREFLQRAYFAYFKLKIKDADTSWISNKVCQMCTERLKQCMNVETSHLKFGNAIIGREWKKKAYPNLLSNRKQCLSIQNMYPFQILVIG